MNILIRCDISYNSGYGHAFRCLALANELKQSYICDIHVSHFSQDSDSRFFRSYGFNVHVPVINDVSPREGVWLHKLIVMLNTDLLILDTRENLSCQDILCIRKMGVFVSLIDDLSDRRLVVDQCFYPPVRQVYEKDWSDSIGDINVGFDWVILNSSFSQDKKKLRTSYISRFEQIYSKEIELNLLIMIGGSDPYDLTFKIMREISKLNTPIEIRVIVGPGYKNLEKLHDLQQDNEKIRIFNSVHDVASIIACSDIGITSFGVSAYEFTFLGLPSLYIAYSDDHYASSALFREKGVAECYYMDNADLMKKILLFIDKYTKNKFLCAQKALSCIDIMPTNGIKNVASKMMSCALLHKAKTAEAD